MERNDIVLSAEQMEMQRQFMQRCHDIFAPNAPLALVDTFGCQQNVADSQRLMGMLQEMGFGFTDDPNQADVILLNTCAIRENAENRVYGTLGHLSHAKTKKPEQILCLCGCMAQQPTVAKKVKESYRHVDLIFGPQALWKFPELLYNFYTRRKRVFSIEDEHGSIAEGLPVVRESSVKAWVSIMYGCNNFCSYCIVPYVRGRERSRDPQAIIAEVQELAEQGYREITLLGQNVNSYGKDLPDPIDFADLLQRLNTIEGDFLIRFMTSHPRDASEKLFNTMASCEKVAHQLHLPFQSGSSRILKAMNRHYDRETYLKKVQYAKSVMPDLVLTSDVIVGFPNETEEDFEDTLSLVQEVEFDALFTFIYSPRHGTPAASMPDPFTRAEKQVRFDRLLNAQNDISARLHAAYVGKTLRVLVDGETGDSRWNLSARTNGGRLVHLDADPSCIGTYIEVTISDSNTWALFGTPTDKQEASVWQS